MAASYSWQRSLWLSNLINQNGKTKMSKKNEANTTSNNDKADQRTRLNQSDIPAFSLEKALDVARAIGDNYAFKPATPLDIASALELIPTTGGFRMLTGASVAYGLTSGGYSASEISITPLGLRIVRPLTDDGDDEKAKREAALTPKIVGTFLRKYDGAALPKQEIAQNVLHSLGVPLDRVQDAYTMILETAKGTGMLRYINDRTFVDLKGAVASAPTPSPDDEAVSGPSSISPLVPQARPISSEPAVSPSIGDGKNLRAKRVFITHGKNRALIEPVKKILTFGDLEAVVSVHSQTVSQPVPGKIMEEMRSCGAAIIHVENERTLVDADGNQEVVLNDNVLIEIGAAMALFGARFILVVKDGVKLPSNLQGLLELRYKGDTLTIDDTGALLDAISDMKKRPLPQ
jgi:predicted nucleotide-binding protein